MRRESLVFFTVLLMLSLIFRGDTHREERQEYTDFSIWDFYIPPLPRNPKKEKEIVYLHNEMLEKMAHSTIDVTEMRKESIGWYYITAYCPSECGYNGYNYPTGWMTASGEICHMSSDEERYTVPSTCAISRAIHSFGDIFFIEEFGLFVAEDTGSAVKGKHLDLFYEDYEDVICFPTGYYEVFAVEYEEKTITLGG